MERRSASGKSIEMDLKDAELAASKHVTRFTWEAVSDGVLRELLAVAYKEKPDEVRKLKEQATPRLAQLTHSVYGNPPKKMLLDCYPDSWGVLQHIWAAREADREQLGHLVAWASLGVPVADRNTVLYTLKGLRGFVAKQNKTVNFKANLRKFFILAHTRRAIN